MISEDLTEVCRLENQAFAHPWGRSAFDSELAISPRLCMVAPPLEPAAPGCTDLPLLAGFICGRLLYDELHIFKIVTAPEFRQQGLALQLLDKLFGVALNDGAMTSTLEVRASNIPAIRCYERAGFSHVGIRHGYYADNNEDALIMTLSLKKETG